jgi:hypothetical protein
MQGQTAFSDGWEVDKPWLSQLFWAEKTDHSAFNMVQMLQKGRLHAIAYAEDIARHQFILAATTTSSARAPSSRPPATCR